MLHIMDIQNHCLKIPDKLKLCDLYEYQCIMFMFDYQSMNLPKSFDGVFIANRDVPNSCLTRQSNLMYIPRIKSTFASKLPYYA